MSKQPTIGSKELADVSASELIDARIRELNDWRGETLARVASPIKEAAPKRSRSGNGGACRCGRMTALSAPARPTRAP